jgi:hypothetical protein
MAQSFVSRITISGLGFDKMKIIKALDTQNKVGILRIFGEISHIQPVESEYGDSIRFCGTFQGINLFTGEETNSTRLFVPKVVEGLLENLCMANFEEKRTSIEDGKNGRPATVSKFMDGSVVFACDIFAITSTKAACGYEYMAENLVEPTTDSPLKRLAAQITTPLPLLGK